MARVTSWFTTTSSSRRHPTEVECGYQVVQAGGERLLQLSTYGSDERQSEKKVSQTLQLDAAAAEKLRSILDEVFPRH
jgi:5-methylcytosine-specific restriction protein B